MAGGLVGVSSGYSTEYFVIFFSVLDLVIVVVAVTLVVYLSGLPCMWRLYLYPVVSVRRALYSWQSVVML